ncbi:MAG TPA: glycosyltransferase [Patescibacteria group bacterium]|nr:glycosyltransferase [Patescibacteria group bacterium]
MENTIAIISQKLSGGGAERVASNLSLELSKYYDVVLILFDGKNRAYLNGGKLIDLGIPADSRMLNKAYNFFRRIVEVKKIKRIYHPVCTISLLDGPNLVNILSKHNDIIITSNRSVVSESINKKYQPKFLIKFIADRSDKVISLSKAVKFDLVKNFSISSSKIDVIYNSCDGERLMALSEKDDGGQSLYENKRPYIVTMGRLVLPKGQWHLIRVFSALHKLMPDLELVILGQGELQERLEELAKEYNIFENVKFLGYINNPHYIIKNAKLFVFSSIYEGLGNSLLEALACGKAIISADSIGGPKEILAPDIDHKITSVEYAQYGVLVPAFTYAEFDSSTPLTQEEKMMADAIIEILNNKVLREEYEEKAKIRAKDFTPEVINTKWRDVIEKLGTK